MVLVKLNYDSCVLPVSGSMMTTKSHEQDDDIKIMLNRITLRPNQGARGYKQSFVSLRTTCGTHLSCSDALVLFPLCGNLDNLSASVLANTACQLAPSLIIYLCASLQHPPLHHYPLFSDVLQSSGITFAVQWITIPR